MMKKAVGRAPSMGKKLIKALGWVITWTLAASVVVAWMLDREIMQIEQTGYAVMGILLVCGVLLGRNPVRGVGKQKLMDAAVATGVFFLCLIIANWMFFGGQFSGFGAALLILLTGAALGSISLRKGRGGGSRRRYKIPKV